MKKQTRPRKRKEASGRIFTWIESLDTITMLIKSRKPRDQKMGYDSLIEMATLLDAYKEKRYGRR